MGMPGGGNEDFIPQGDGDARLGALQTALEESGEDNGDIDQLIRSKAVEAAT